jgi:2-polyprenyl-6-methoxyphenol hydroxylase-like FAD-dependent oxidoreductase
MTRLDPIADRYDALVVGARAAGAATALLLARQGLSVLVVDRGRYGSDTLSTLALMRGGVLQLSRWGLAGRLRAAGTPAVTRTTFHYGEGSITVAIKPGDGVDALCAPRRTLLDSTLVDAAVAAGASVLHEVRMTRLLRAADGRVEGAELETAGGAPRRVRAGIVIGADGVRSGVARLAGARALRVGRHASGVVYGFWEGVADDGFHWHYVPGAAAGVIPTNGGATLVFSAVARRRFLDEIRWDLAAGHQRVIAEVSPPLAAALGRARALESLRGFPGETGVLRQAWGPGWALVGDAGHFKDPITAHGLTDALRDAELLARAVAAGTEHALADYQTRRDELAVPLLDISDAVAGYDWTLEQVQTLHRELSAAMKQEVAALLALDSASPAAALAGG